MRIQLFSVVKAYSYVIRFLMFPTEHNSIEPVEVNIPATLG